MGYSENDIQRLERDSSILRTSHENERSSNTTNKDCGIRKNEEDRNKYDPDGLPATENHMPGPTAQSKSTTAAEAIKTKWYHKLNPINSRGTTASPREYTVSREYHAGFLSKLAFQWITPLITTGYKRQLKQGDIWTVHPNRAVEPLTNRVRWFFKQYVNGRQKHPLLRALYVSFRFEFYFGGICALFGAVLRVMAAFTLRFLIQFASDAHRAHTLGKPAPPIYHGVGLLIGITTMVVLQSICTNHFMYSGKLFGGQSRGVLVAMIYAKANGISTKVRSGATRDSMKLESHHERNTVLKHTMSKAKVEQLQASRKREMARQLRNETGWTNGYITSLINVDVMRIDTAAAQFHIIWTSPFACLITLAALLVNLTYSALPGFGLLVIGTLLLALATRRLIRRRNRINKMSDQRVSLLRETLLSIRTIKYFAWEKAFKDNVDAIRDKEVSAVKGFLATRNAVNTTNMLLPVFASMLSFIAYSLSNHGLSPARIFSALALFNALRIPLNLLPPVVSQVADAWASLRRVEEFLMEEEESDMMSYGLDGPNAIEIRNVTFSWKAPPLNENNTDHGTGVAESQTRPSSFDGIGDKKPFALPNLNLNFGRSELIAVIGTVGSGKSSLLAALAGGMHKMSGDVAIASSRAFCPQDVWLQNATVENNITFGKTMNKLRYEEVVEACCLRPDIDMFPKRDGTELGEHGIVISGGQKQRLNIARAVYCDADIVLLDDPLSAVDSNVGRQIFNNAILGLLRNKCRVLATHQLWVLHRCDRIIWMDAGNIRANDTFQNLVRTDSDFRALIDTTFGEKPTTQLIDPRANAKQAFRAVEGISAVVPAQQEDDSNSAGCHRSAYGDYLRATGSSCSSIFILCILSLAQGAKIMTILWLSYWTANKFSLRTEQYVGIYVALGVAQAVLVLLFSETLVIFAMKASHSVFRRGFSGILFAPMSFFDIIPTGRILHNLSHDVDVMDTSLPGAIRILCFTIAMIVSVAGLIIAFFPYFAIAAGLSTLLFIFTTLYYSASASELRRIESSLRSRVVSQFSENLRGVPTIRAYGLTQQFIKDLFVLIDEMSGAYYLAIANQRWLSIRLDCIGNALVFTTGMLVITSRFSVHPSTSGLVLSCVLTVVQMLQFAVRELSEVQIGMHSVENICNYHRELGGPTGYSSEAPKLTPRVHKSWPRKGEIIFNNVELRYREHLPLILRGLSMRINPGQRIAIVGRTGTGKTSVINALFRFVELSGGSITIDGLDISTIALHDLRSRLAIIPQDVTLFHGTVRSNLDPFNEQKDSTLWSALHGACLTPPSAQGDNRGDGVEIRQRLHLDTAVEEDGRNFSLGQRQLIAFARALVRDSKIVVFDEATSSVDMKTDKMIQRTVAEAFRGKTMICIAHRLQSIISYDCIYVMDAGRVIESDTALALWHHGGTFKKLCDESGICLDDIRAASSV